MTPANYVQEYKGRFYVAEYAVGAAQYRGPLTARIAKKTGCSGFFCKLLAGLVGAGGYSYSRRSDALRKVRELYGDE